MIEIIVGALFLSIFMIILTIFLSFRRRFQGLDTQIKKKVTQYSDSRKLKPGEVPFIIKDESYSQNPLFNRILESLKFSEKLQKLLNQAGNPMKLDRLFIYMILFGLIGFFLGIKMGNPLLALIFGPGMALLPVLHVKILKSKRIRDFTKEFPDAIDMMADAIKAGNAFNKALLMVANESPDPVGIEFRKTFEEQNLGIPLIEALTNLSNRVESLDLKLFITAVSLQKDTGGNLAEILNSISYTIRERFKLMGQIRVYTAQARFSAFVVGSLPIAFIIFIRIINPDYINVLFYEPEGKKLLALAVILQILGFLSIKKIVNIKLS